MLAKVIRQCRIFLGRVIGREAKRLQGRIGALRLELAAARTSAAENAALYAEAHARMQALRSPAHPSEYSALAPAPLNALTLFPGAWSSTLPNAQGPGSVPLFADERMIWAIKQLSDITGWKVLELGPLEGGHTYMLEQAGATVTAIEGNHNSFLRCLITKNYLGMKSKFVLGDFATSFSDETNLDLVVASGVLYHMTNPVDLLQKIAAVSSRLYMWTHYYHPDLSLWDDNVRAQVGTKWRPDMMETVRVGNLDVRIVPQSYGESLGWDGFCGGPEAHSNWVYRDDLLQLLKDLGYTNIEVTLEQTNHVNGPSFCVLAQK